MNEEAWLQFWHAELNRLFFNGELEPALIHIDVADEHDDEEHPLAAFYGRFNPFLITFYYDPIDEDKVRTLGVLLHEMTHQYCEEHGIEGMDENGEHSSEFYRIASEHGLVYHGAVLSDEARASLLQRIETVNVVNSVRAK